jgi:hypothetical protein
MRTAEKNLSENWHIGPSFIFIVDDWVYSAAGTMAWSLGAVFLDFFLTEVISTQSSANEVNI